MASLKWRTAFVPVLEGNSRGKDDSVGLFYKRPVSSKHSSQSCSQIIYIKDFMKCIPLRCSHRIPRKLTSHPTVRQS